MKLLCIGASMTNAILTHGVLEGKRDILSMFTLHSEEQALIELDFCSEKIRCVEKPLQEKKTFFATDVFLVVVVVVIFSLNLRNED